MAIWRKRPAKEHPLVWRHLSGRKSLAFAMVVRAPDRTLTAADATGVRDAALAAAAERVGAALR